MVAALALAAFVAPIDAVPTAPAPMEQQCKCDGSKGKDKGDKGEVTENCEGKDKGKRRGKCKDKGEATEG